MPARSEAEDQSARRALGATLGQVPCLSAAYRELSLEAADLPLEAVVGELAGLSAALLAAGDVWAQELESVFRSLEELAGDETAGQETSGEETALAFLAGLGEAALEAADPYLHPRCAALAAQLRRH
ncbi:MAG: hypothetical protein JWM85_309 [Acidimicrobiaceae bacterium]|nr:hypothetical protein [Acidimicrobiaceae bacterium]